MKTATPVMPCRQFRSKHPSLCQATARGFTLVELLLVLVLVTVLLVLAFSAMSSVRKSMSGARCTANLRTLTTALLSYANDHDNRLPNYDDMPTQGNSWWRRIQPYLGYAERTPETDKEQDKRLRCPEERDASIVSTYGANYGFIIDYANVSRHLGSMKVSAIPASAYLVAECKGPIPAIYNPGWWRFSRDADGDGVPDSDSRLGQPYNHFAFRHRNTGLAAFADGSVRVVSKLDWTTNANEMWGPFYDK